MRCWASVSASRPVQRPEESTVQTPAVSPQTSTWHQVKILLVREGVLGLVVYIASVPDRVGNALLGLTLFICTVLWSLHDGVLPKLARSRWSVILLEGLLLYLGAIAAANTLRLAFGQMPAAW